MRLLSIFASLLAFVSTALAEWDSCILPTVDWIVTDQGIGSSMAYATAPSQNHGVFIAGSFNRILELRGPGGVLSVTNGATSDSSSNDDVYVAQISTEGAPVKIKTFTGAQRQLIIDAAYDDTANALAIGGYHLGSITFGTNTLTNSKAAGTGFYDGFMVVLDFDGTDLTPRWAVSYPNNQTTRYTGVDIFNNGNPVGIGNTCDNDPDINHYVNGKPGALCAGFIVSYDKTDGTEVWNFQYPNFYPETVRIDADGIFVVGTLEGSQDFQQSPSGTINLTPTGDTDVVVLKLDPATGKVLANYKKGVAGKSYSAWEISLGASSVLISGYTDEGSFDGFALRVNKALTTLQTLMFIPSARGIQFNEAENAIYLMGYLGQTTQLGSLKLELRGSFDMYVLKVSVGNNGDPTLDGVGVWGIVMGGDGLEYPWSMFRGADDNLYISGLTSSSVAQFGKEEFIDTAITYNNAFLAKVMTAEVAPGCLTSCTGTGNNIAAIVSGQCFINNECYASGEVSPMDSSACFKCDSTASQTSWTGPILDSYCYIDGACVASGTHRTLTGTVTSQSKCQVCDPAKKGDGWTLLAGFKLASDGKTCQSDGSIPAGSFTPGCPGSLTYNEAFCGSVTPCYSSSSDSCSAAVTVCPSGTTYASNCPEFPLKPCFNSANLTCISAAYPTATDDIFCGNTGQYIYVDKCPVDYPCYDHINRICTPVQTKSGAEKLNMNQFMMMAGIVVATIASFF